MVRYKIVIAYDGTDFHGWQVQPRDRTVVSVLKESFESCFSHGINIIGASRTDSGVHALGQVAVVSTTLDIDPSNMCEAWNRSLPRSIVVRSVDRVSSDFHIFADVISKTYYYHLFLKRPIPFISRYGWFWRFMWQVDLSKFYKALDSFVGEHDFRSFCKNEEGVKTVRTVDSIEISEISRFSAIRVQVKGKGFLRYQIRRMIGSALDVSRRSDLPIDFITDQLKNPKDQQAFTKAEACGLCLRKIIYKR